MLGGIVVFGLFALTRGVVFIVVPVQSVGTTALGLLLAVIYATLGGYVAAHVARRAEVNHALALGVCTALVVLFVPALAASAAEPVWYRIILALIFASAPILGGRLRAVTR